MPPTRRTAEMTIRIEPLPGGCAATTSKEEVNPTTLEEAFTTLTCYSAQKDAYVRLSRHEEPMEVSPVNPAPSRPVVAQDDQTTTTLLKKLLQSQERLQTKVAKLKAQARPPRTATAPATWPAFRERGQGLCRSPGLAGPLTKILAASGVAALATCAESAAKASLETDKSRRGDLRSTSGRFTGGRPVHQGIGGDRGLLYAPTTRYFSQNGGSCSSPQAASRCPSLARRL